MPPVISLTHASDEFLVSVDISFYCFMGIPVIESVCYSVEILAKVDRASIYLGENCSCGQQGFVRRHNTLYMNRGARQFDEQ